MQLILWSYDFIAAAAAADGNVDEYDEDKIVPMVVMTIAMSHFQVLPYLLWTLSSSS